MIKFLVATYLSISVAFFAVFLIVRGYTHINEGDKEPSTWLKSLMDSAKFGLCWPVFIKDLFNKEKLAEVKEKVEEVKEVLTKEKEQNQEAKVEEPVEHVVLSEEGKTIDAEETPEHIEIVVNDSEVVVEPSEEHEVVIEEDKQK